MCGILKYELSSRTFQGCMVYTTWQGCVNSEVCIYTWKCKTNEGNKNSSWFTKKSLVPRLLSSFLVHNVCTLAMWLYKTRDEPGNEATFMIVQHHTSMHTPHACTPHVCTPHTQYLWHLGFSGSGMPCKMTVLHVCGWSTKDLCASVYWRRQSVIHTVHKLVKYYVAWLCSMP